MFSMGRQRQELTPECKDEAAKLVITTGRAVATVARELGLHEATVGRWVHLLHAVKRETSPSTLHTTTVRSGHGERDTPDASSPPSSPTPPLTPPEPVATTKVRVPTAAELPSGLKHPDR